jgi:hypothetical protein
LAYGGKLDQALQSANIRALSAAARHAYLAISHRRLFVKTLVTEWYRQKEQGEAALSLEVASALIKGQSDALNLLADAQQSPY